MAQRSKTTAKRTSRPITRPLHESDAGRRADAYYHELQTLHDLSQTVLASLDIQTILERILDKSLLAGSFDVGVIRLLDPSRGTLRPMAHRGYRNPANVRGKTTDPKDEATGMILVQVIAARGSYPIEDVPHSRGMRSFRKEGVQSAIVVPVRAGEEILGVIQLGSRRARRFKPHEIHLFEAIGNQMGLAVQKARLYEQAEQRLTHAEALRDIGLSLTATHDPMQVLTRVAEEARRLTGALFAFVVTPDKPFYKITAVAGEDKRYREVLKLSADPASPYGQGPLGRAVRSRESVVCEDVLMDPLFKPWREIASERGIRSLVAVPLIVQDKPYGAILTYAPIPRAYDAEIMGLLGSLAAQAAAALENARLYQESQKQAEIQSLLKELSQDVTSLQSDRLLKKITEKAREFLRVDISDVRIMEKGVYKLIGVSGIEPEQIRGTGSNRGRSKWILENRRPVVIQDTATESRFSVGETVRRLGLRGYLAVPLFSRGGDVLGVLRVMSYQPREFTQQDVDLLQQLANGAAVALENARLFEETEHRAREQATLNAIATAMSQSLRIDEVLQIALDKVLEVTGREKGYIRLKDPLTGEINLAARRGISKEYTETLTHRRRLGGKSDQVFESGEPLIVNDPEGGMLKDQTRREGQYALAWIPLKARGTVVGILNVATSRPIPFEPREVNLLQAIGSVVGVAVENARLFEETKSSLERIRLLREIDTAIASTLDLGALLHLLMERIDAALPYPTTITIRLLNGNSGELEPVACRNIAVDEWKVRNWTGSRGPGNWVTENKASVFVRNVQADPRTLDREFFRKYGLLSYFGVPLIAKGEIIGVIGFYTKEEHEFTGEEREFLSTLAGQAGIAIHNSQLYGETKTKAAELAISNRVKDEFLSVMSHELRTPLTSLMGYTGMMQDGVLGEIGREQEKALEKMAAFSRSLLAMIETIMEATKIETGAIVVERQDVNLIDALDILKSSYDHSVGKDISLVWEYPDDLPTIQTDAAKLKQILQHLLNNAIKFTEKGSVTVSVWLKEGNTQQAVDDRKSEPGNSTHASRLEAPACVAFKVADTGIGIPKEAISLIFEKFRQVDSSETRVYGGVGLGLYIVKTFTERLGGIIEVQSELGKGSTFTVTLPYQSESPLRAQEDERRERPNPNQVDE